MKTKMMSFRGQATWAKIVSLGGKLTALGCHPTRKVNKAEELTREYKRVKYHCTVDLLFDWFGISCMTTDNNQSKRRSMVH